MTTSTPDRPSLLDPAASTDPFAWFARLREHGPVVPGTAFDGSPLHYVTRDADVRFVLSDPRFVTRPVEGGTDPRRAMLEQIGVPAGSIGYLTDTILDAAGADHTRLRKLVSRAFTVRRVTAMRPRVEEIATHLLDDLTGSVDLVSTYAYPLPTTVISELVGVPEDERPQWRRWGDSLIAMDPERISVAIPEMIGYCHDLVARRRAEPTDDLVSDLVRAQEEDGDRLSDAEMVTMVLTLVVAGHETTAHLIANSVPVLLDHPDQLDRLRRDPAGWPLAVAELMRYASPVTVTRQRYAAVDVEIAGTLVRRGEGVQPLLLSANTDPRVHDDPQTFDAVRHGDTHGEGHVGFGFGVHYCLGAALARQEAEVALSVLFDRFPGLALDGEPELRSRMGTRMFARLPVQLG